MLSLDYLAFSYVPCKSLAELPAGKNELDLFISSFPELESFFNDNFTMCSSGRFYDNVVSLTDLCLISYNVLEGSRYSSGKLTPMGVNVSIPSHGLCWFFDLFGLDLDSPDSLVTLLKILKERSCRLSRIDLAFDDFTKKYTPTDYNRFNCFHAIKTKFRYIKFLQSTGTKGGDTIYFGDRKNGKLLRIYDKAYESKGEVDSIRYEIELHSVYARNMMDYIIDNGYFDFVSYLKSDCFTIVLGDNECNIERRSNRPINPEWEDWTKSVFCEELQPYIHLPRKRVSPSVESIEKWIEGAVLPTLRAYVDIVGFDLFRDMLKKTRVPDRLTFLFDPIYKDAFLWSLPKS